MGVGGKCVRVDVNEEFKFFGKFNKKNWGGVQVVGFGGQGGCERRIEVFVKIQKKKLGGGEGLGSGASREGVGFGGGVRVDVNEELKFL